MAAKIPKDLVDLRRTMNEACAAVECVQAANKETLKPEAQVRFDLQYGVALRDFQKASKAYHDLLKWYVDNAA